MQDKKLTTYKIVSYVLGGICLVCAVWLLVLLISASWKFFAIKPVWLGFLLLLILGMGLMFLCAIIYLQMCAKENLRQTVLCANCGAACHCDSAFCSSCGAKLEKEE